MRFIAPQKLKNCDRLWLHPTPVMELRTLPDSLVDWGKGKPRYWTHPTRRLWRLNHCALN